MIRRQEPPRKAVRIKRESVSQRPKNQVNYCALMIFPESGQVNGSFRSGSQQPSHYYHSTDFASQVTLARVGSILVRAASCNFVDRP